MIFQDKPRNVCNFGVHLSHFCGYFSEMMPVRKLVMQEHRLFFLSNWQGTV